MDGADFIIGFLAGGILVGVLLLTLTGEYIPVETYQQLECSVDLERVEMVSDSVLVILEDKPYCLQFIDSVKGN